MSYGKTIEYRIIPKDSYRIYRNCANCKSKMTYMNTNCFRVNANGNKVDIWLIYQCTKCRHTYNLTIYERKKPSEINPNEYNKFLANDKNLAVKYGSDKQFFAKNKAEIDYSSMTYSVKEKHFHPPYLGSITDKSVICMGVKILGGKVEKFQKGDCIIIHNLDELKIRMDKVLSEILNISRNRVNDLIQNKKIISEQKYLSHLTTVIIDGENIGEKM